MEGSSIKNRQGSDINPQNFCSGCNSYGFFDCHEHNSLNKSSAKNYYEF